jgi:hypothetical protein
VLDVVGLGSQDDLAYAEEFVDRFEPSFTMLWDPGFESWAQLGVSLQPSAMLLGSNGELLGKWLGMFPEDEVVRLAEGAPPVGVVAADGSRFCRYADRYARAVGDLEGYPTEDDPTRRRRVDDLRFAANATAQTAAADLAPGTADLADSARELGDVLLDSGLDPAAWESAALAEARSELATAQSELADAVLDRCGVTW